MKKSSDVFLDIDHLKFVVHIKSQLEEKYYS